MTKTAKKRVTLKRWNLEEIEFLQARFDKPFKVVFEEYRGAGFSRSNRAVSVKFYGLKKAAGKTAPRGNGVGMSIVGKVGPGLDGSGSWDHALELARRYDLAALEAAVEIRGVLDRLAR